MKYETVWEFATANFRVALEIAPEDMDPADSFEFDDDIAAVRNGDVEWFCAKVAVYGPDDEELASDQLGGCAYRTVREFYTSHRDPDPANRNSSLSKHGKAFNSYICHYFPDMVSQAIDQARIELARRRDRYAAIKLRS